MYCKNCGSEIKEEQKFCPKCGTFIENTETHKKINGKKVKKISIILIVILVIGLCSHIGINIYKNGKYCSQQTIIHNLSSSIAKMTTIYRQDGQILSEVNIDNTNDIEEKTITNYEYDSLGRMIKIYGDDPEEGEMSIDIVYSEKDNQYVGKGSFSDGSGSMEIIYNKKAVLISRTEFFDDAKSYNKSIYNNDGKVIEKISVIDEKESYKDVYEYDKNGNLSKTYSYSNGQLSVIQEYFAEDSGKEQINKITEFDENEKIISEETYYSKITEQSPNVYKTVIYDENNETDGNYYISTYDNNISKNMIKHEVFIEGGSNSVTEYEYKWKDFTKLDTWKEILF